LKYKIGKFFGNKHIYINLLDTESSKCISSCFVSHKFCPTAVSIWSYLY